MSEQLPKETMVRPIGVDLFCGLGGWTEGLLAEGYYVVGFDIEHHRYGDEKYPAQLVLQNVLTIHGRQFKDASLIVASPPCQEFSYMAMPWSRAKQKIEDYESGVLDRAELTKLFDACFRIQREACDAAGRHVPMVVENVRGAQRWVGRARWNFGSFYLWGDVPALMPIVSKHVKVPGFRFDGSGKSFQSQSVEHTKNNGGSWFNIAHNTTSGKGNNPDGRKTVGHVNKRDGHRSTAHLTNQRESDAIKQGGDWFSDSNGTLRSHGSKSSARKAASARIAKIPFALSTHIAKYWKPIEVAA